MASPRPTLLVVDDNSATRYSTSRVLRSANFEVLEAGTGGEALALAARRPDLVVLDINLPDIDGFQVCRRLRSMPETAHIPVVHLSATFVNDVDKVQGLEAGADGYLTHPVEPPVLVATVRAFLRARHAEVAMRASEAKFKAVFDQALHGIALISDGLMFLDVNPAMGRLLGREATAVVGKHLSAFVPQAFEHSVDEVRTGVSSGSWRGTFPVVHADGRPVDLEWTISLHSEPDIRLAIVADVTERQGIEAERERLLSSERAARAEAERANNSKDEFLAALSHELRTPLNTIVGWARVLKDRLGRQDEQVAKGIDAIERNARVQAQLISDLLDVARITSGKLTLELQEFQPGETVLAAAEGLQRMASARGIVLDVEVDPQATSLHWDLARFHQVVWNLVDNAIKFSGEGGRVRVELLHRPDAIILSVNDHGRGLSVEFLPHVFERFRQEDASSRRHHGGLGLGLAIVSQLVEAHGGTIAVASPGEGLGATFTVTMPHNASRSSSTEWTGGPNLSGLRALVVEDDDDARSFVHRILREAGAEVQDAVDVATALEAVKSFRPGLLVSDVGMPGADGYDLIRRVRALGRGADVLPAIALTAFARDEDRQRLLAAGYQRHLAKPINALRLLELAAELTAAPSTNSSTA